MAPNGRLKVPTAPVPVDYLALVLTGALVSSRASEELAARERALLEAMRDDPEAGVVQWAKATRCDKSAVSMRLGRLAKRGVVERDGNGRWRLAGVNPTMPPSL